MPSYLSLIPTISTAGLLIVISNKKNLIYKFLVLKPFIFLGKISYSLYLIHFPIIVLFTFEKNFTNIFSFLVIIIFLSYLSWKFIENPFRNKILINDKQFIKIIFLSILFILSLSYLIKYCSNKGYFEKIIFFNSNEKIKLAYKEIMFVKKQRQIKEILPYECKIFTNDIDEKFLNKFNNCLKYNKTFIIILGDSHGEDLYKAFVKTTNYNFVLGLSPQGCRPYSKYEICKKRFENFKKFIGNNINQISLLIYTQGGSKFLKNNLSLPVDIDKVKKVETFLKGLGVKDILFVGPNFEPNLKMNYGTIKSYINKSLHKSENLLIHDVDNVLEQNFTNSSITYFSRIKELSYDPNIDLFVNNKLTYMDSEHWSNFGEIYFGNKIFNNVFFKNYFLKFNFD